MTPGQFKHESNENFAEFIDHEHRLQWIDCHGRTVTIELKNVDTLQFNARSGHDTRTVAQLQATTTFLLTKQYPDLPLCLAREHLNDPRSHLWRGIAADVVGAASFYSARKTQILGYPEDRVIALGLSCLDIALSMLLAVQRVFGEVHTSSEPQSFHRYPNCENVSQLRLSLTRFLEALQELALIPPFSEELANHLTIVYGILILFLIRCTLRSTFQGFQHGFKPFESQNSHDAFLVLGSACPVYQPNLAVLEASNMTIARSWPSEESKDRKSMWLYTQCQRVGKLLAMPDGMNKTLGEHLECSINRWLDL